MRQLFYILVLLFSNISLGSDKLPPKFLTISGQIFFYSTVPMVSVRKAQRFLFIGGRSAQEIESKITDQIDGAQIVYSWKSLEPEKNTYDFGKIEQDLAFLTAR